MKSLSSSSILRALDHPVTSRILLGIETYNATTLDRESNLLAQKLWREFPDTAQVDNSDAHLLDALWIGSTDIRQGEHLSSAQILGSWAWNFVMSAPARIGMNYP